MTADQRLLLCLMSAIASGQVAPLPEVDFDEFRVFAEIERDRAGVDSGEP